MTQLDHARKNSLSPLMKQVARSEGTSPALLLKGIKEGRIVIPLNNRHKVSKPCAIGSGLRTKVNANIGTSTDKSSASYELKKLQALVKAGADTVMDLSVGGDLKKIRAQVIERSPIPVGTVPVYEVSVNAQKKHGNLLAFDEWDMLAVLDVQARAGVDFFTIHAGVTGYSLRQLKNSRRTMGIVSRGGAIIAAWVKRYKKENPFYEQFDRILDIAHQYDVTLSLGDGLRPGSVLDATDQAQIAELRILGELAERCRQKNVQVMIEGPGHVPLDQIEENIRLEKKICRGAPFYVLGPLVTDVASGYDHITGAIGGAIAAWAGADFLCYVTPSEHLRHPSIEDVVEGVVASRIAGHAADIVKRSGPALKWDRAMSKARKNRDWKEQIRLSIDPEKARRYRHSSRPQVSGVCTMCGSYCSIKLSQDCLRA